MENNTLQQWKEETLCLTKIKLRYKIGQDFLDKQYNGQYDPAAMKGRNPLSDKD